jgi:hypothetical protein
LYNEIKPIKRCKMSGGRKIEDHAFWAGSHGKGTVMPDGAKTKEVGSADGFGSLSHYEDTNETIVSQQKMNSSKVHGHPQKPGHRN